MCGSSRTGAAPGSTTAPTGLASVPGPEESSGATMADGARHAHPTDSGTNGVLGSWGPGLSSVCLGSSVMLQAVVRERWDQKGTGSIG